MPARSSKARPSPARDALASGAVVVTPNNRLARHLVALHDEEQRAAGRVVWLAPSVLPWSAWLERLWLDVLAAGCRPEPPRRISQGQSAYLWARLVAAEGLPLMDENGAANLAAKAWSLVHAWGAGGPSWRSWSGGDDDGAVFARWAEDYRATIERLGGLDDAQLPDWLARCAPDVPMWRETSVAMAGFLEFSPQQERLLAGVSAAGMRVARVPTLAGAEGDANARAVRTAGTTPRDEIARALTWARARTLADPGATLAIAIEDLESRRAEVRALADEILCPGLQWPGHEEGARPYNLSLGVAASDVPLVATALDLVALAHAPLPITRAATLVRSPYMAGGGDDWLRRAALEKKWLQEGRRDISLAGIVAAAGAQDRAFAPLQRAVESGPKGHAALSPRAWAEAWRAWVEAAGWPGDRGLSSAEWQARGVWDEALAEFASLGFVAPGMRRAEAIAALVALARAKVFQPESPPAPIQILGMLEAAGLSFDGLWVAGLAADTWPPAPQPNPLLPIAWQRDHNVPRSSAARELAYARALATQWAMAAPEVVFSYAATAEDYPRTSSLLVNAAAFHAGDAPRPTTGQAQLDGAPEHEGLVDDRAPPLADGTAVRGGTGLIAAQGDCPFRAVAIHRLRVDRWPLPQDGLSPIERGILVHAAMAAFWRDVRDHATLVALPEDELVRRIEVAVSTAVACILPARWSRLPAVVAAGEPLRLAKIVRAWLDDFDRVRPPFAVTDMEVSRPLRLKGLELALRLDRIDALAGGGTAVIDYKTGFVSSPPRWFDDRPLDPQLGLYWLSQQAFDAAQPVRALAYAQLRPGELKAVGLAEDAAAWPRLFGPAELRNPGLADWRAVELRWRETLGAMATEVREGRAAVAPRDTIETCRRCGLQALCRIGGTTADRESEDGDA